MRLELYWVFVGDIVGLVMLGLELGVLVPYVGGEVKLVFIGIREFFFVGVVVV